MRYLLMTAAVIAAPIAPATAQDDPAAPVSQERLQSNVETMISFGTRHTLSSYDDPERGIGAALNWGRAEFDEASVACGDCLETLFVEDMRSGRRIPEPVLIRNALAIQWGSERPNEVVIIQGHIDSRGSDVMDADVEAPGANDNASGSALVLEAARALSQRQYPTTIIYALLSGEEQGLYGGNVLADYVTSQGWTVKAVLNNDVVGGSCGSDGVCDADHVRVFSEGVRADADDATRAAMRSRGGANDSPSRNLSRFLDTLAERTEGGLDVRQTWRSDRMGRGGDHLPFLDRGYPAIRLSVAIEDYDHQHQDLRVEDGVTYGDTADEMDFPYLAQVTRLNVRAADVLARAPMPPVVTAAGAVRTSTLLQWDSAPDVAAYRIYRRRTDEAYWGNEPVLTVDTGTEAMDEYRTSGSASVESDATVILTSDEGLSVELVAQRGDDWIFGVSSVASDGSESPVSSAVPGGGFYPLPIDTED
ncbi:M28 family peptidase [Aurantiacibacter marinus]|uniref:Peptidase M28 n=1 Tax=Aurantiacibacter marinus TaxID=874156 RepID=A0A0H0XMS0_9SPHN|nr:M28 family peptidase [Aurantiacibacter marinus]KLI63868.1 peptidase M28 [Aurantiacibacter marinus]